MKNMIKVLWYIIVSAMVLAMFVMVTSKVFAHGQGKCITDPSGNVFLGDDSYVKVVDHLKGAKLDIRGLDENNEKKPPYLHGHQQQYYDRNDNPTTPSTSFFDIDFDDPNSPYYGVFDDFYVDCPTAPQPSQPEVPRQSTTRTTRRVPTTTTPPPPKSSGVSEEVVEQMEEIQAIDPYPVCEDGVLVKDYEWKIIERPQLIGFPILPMGVETIRELYDLFEECLGVDRFLSQLFVNERWASNRENPEIGDTLITPHMGMMVSLPESVRFIGCQQQGEVVDLQPGIHLIGLPEVPQIYQRASDFLSADGIEWVKLGYHAKRVSSEDDPDDQDLRAGQAIRISVTNAVTLDLRGTIVETLAAPSVRRRGTLATSWGAMKR